jgi:hypothetical protein
MARAGAEVGKLGGLILFDVYGFAYGTGIGTSITYMFDAVSSLLYSLLHVCIIII